MLFWIAILCQIGFFESQILYEVMEINTDFNLSWPYTKL